MIISTTIGACFLGYILYPVVIRLLRRLFAARALGGSPESAVFTLIRLMGIIVTNLLGRFSYFVSNWILSTNHRRIAVMYFIFTIITGFTGLILATIIRIELAYPGQGILNNNSEKYLTIAALHAIVMVFFVVIPILFGAFGNFLLPTQLGIRDVAFPRLNSFMFWITPAGFVLLLHILLFDKSYKLTYWLNYSELSAHLHRRHTEVVVPQQLPRIEDDYESLALRLLTSPHVPAPTPSTVRLLTEAPRITSSLPAFHNQSRNGNYLISLVRNAAFSIANSINTMLTRGSAICSHCRDVLSFFPEAYNVQNGVMSSFGLANFMLNPAIFLVYVVRSIFYNITCFTKYNHDVHTTWGVYSSLCIESRDAGNGELPLGLQICRPLPQQWFLFNPTLMACWSRYLLLFDNGLPQLSPSAAKISSAPLAVLRGLSRFKNKDDNRTNLVTSGMIQAPGVAFNFKGLINTCANALLARAAALHYGEFLFLPQTTTTPLSSYLVGLFTSVKSVTLQSWMLAMPLLPTLGVRDLFALEFSRDRILWELTTHLALWPALLAYRAKRQQIVDTPGLVLAQYGFVDFGAGFWLSCVLRPILPSRLISFTTHVSSLAILSEMQILGNIDICLKPTLIRFFYTLLENQLLYVGEIAHNAIVHSGSVPSSALLLALQPNLVISYPSRLRVVDSKFNTTTVDVNIANIGTLSVLSKQVDLKAVFRLYSQYASTYDYLSDWRLLKLEREVWRSVDVLSGGRNHWLNRPRYYTGLKQASAVINKVSIWSPNHLIPGWAFITPYTSRLRHTSLGKVDIALIVVFMAGLGSVFSAVNYVITYRYIGAPILKNRKELRSFYVDALLVGSRMMIVANPALLIAILLLLSDRHWGTSVFDFSGGGDTILFQHLFWFFGHPEVYIVIIPCFGFMNSLLPYYLRKRLSGRLSLQFSMYTIAFMAFAVWGHHMYMVGLANSVRTLYSTGTVMISVPASTKILHWCVTIIQSSLSCDVGFLFLLAFMYFFVLGGLSGMFVAHLGFDVVFHDTFYVIGHFHVMFASAAMCCIFAGFYFYFASIFGVRYSRFFAYLHFIFFCFGQLMTITPMIFLGYAGMPRRVMDYPAVFGGWHSVISSGHFLIVLSFVFFLCMLLDSFFENKSPVAKTRGVSRLNTRLGFFSYEIRKLSYSRKKTQMLLRRELGCRQTNLAQTQLVDSEMSTTAYVFRRVHN